MLPLKFKEPISSSAPLAERMRPITLNDFVGQEHILGTDKPLRRLVEKDAVGSIILWGPPGIGKTTLARIIAKITKKGFVEISAVNSGVADIRKVIHAAKQDKLAFNKHTILFIDEVHRFNKAQQDAILPYVEKGTVSLIGSTTENPSFEVIPALRSRSQVFRLQYLSYENIHFILNKTLKSEHGFGSLKLEIEDKAIERIILSANGDARFALNVLESVVSLEKGTHSEPILITEKNVSEILQQSFIMYDKKGNEHYNHASAFQKSLRGSDPDAAVYWLAKMIAGGEETRFIARRLIVTAAEDVGNANPMALVVATAAAEAAEKLGFPEGRIPLSQAAIYVANSPKCNSALTAIDAALDDIRNKGMSYPVPDHLKDAHYSDAKSHGFGVGYKHPNSYSNNHVDQTYLPDQLKERKYYEPKPRSSRKIL